MPLIVALMLDMALVFRFKRSEARLDLCSGPGDPPDMRRPWVGGLCETPNILYQYIEHRISNIIYINVYIIVCYDETVGGPSQSWTNSETFGLTTRLLVFFDEGFVVITMTGAEEYCEEGM